MYSGEAKSAWLKKGATLSDKSAQKEFGLTQEEIIDAINGGKLQYRNNNIFGNPYFRLLRSEVESFVEEKYGSNYLKKKKIKKELTQTNGTVEFSSEITSFLEGYLSFTAEHTEHAEASEKLSTD